MDERERVNRILARLDENYGTECICYLDYGAPWQLLIAAVLSVQCKEERVNRVTARLFDRYPSVEALARADAGDVEREVYTLGFYRNKARHIIACAGILEKKYGGQVPYTWRELTALPGVGRKTVNLIRGYIYGEPGIVVDGHVRRVSKMLGFTEEDDPELVEYDLMQALPKDRWLCYGTQMIKHGRSLCPEKNPLCGQCFLNELCLKGDCYWYKKYEEQEGGELL